MAVPYELQGTMRGSGYIKAEMFNPKTEDRDGQPGLIVYTQDRVHKTYATQPLVSAASGFGMNTSVGFSGTPDGIHDGTDSVLWTGTALSGTWDFASTTQAAAGTKSVDATAAIRNTEAQFERSSAIAPSSYTAISGCIYITSWPTTGTKEVEVRLRLAGGDVGASLDLSNYVDTLTFNSWQSFIIPVDDFGAGSNIDQIVIKQIDSGPGLAPTYFLDEFQFEETGGFEDFTYAPGAKEVFHVELIAQGAVTNTTEALMKSYDKFFGIPALSNGILTVIQQNNLLLPSIAFKRTFDVIPFPQSQPFEVFGDGTNTVGKLASQFRIDLDGRKHDSFTYRVQDDLSSLLELNVWLYGWIEVVD